MLRGSRVLRRGGSVALCCCLLSAGLLATAATTTAPAGAAVPTGPFTVDINNREDVRQLYNQVHEATNGVEPGWTGGDVGTCTPGSDSPDYLAAMLSRINYFRTMAGEPNVTFNGTDAGTSADPNNAEAQAAALMEAANPDLTLPGANPHNPPQEGTNCWTQQSFDGSSHSNLSGGVTPAAIDGLMYDGSELGHRRNMLDPAIATMGVGAVTPTPGTAAYYLAQLVLTTPVSPRPATRTPYVAWPPAGFVPYQVVPARWSFGLPNGDFSAATVTVQHNGTTLPTQIQCFNPDNTTVDPNCGGSPSSPGSPQFGDPAIIWKLNVADGDNWPPPTADDPYTVTIGNVVVNGGAPQDFTYTVTVIDPAMYAGQWFAPTGPASPPVGQSSTYTFPAVVGATGYQWRTTPLSAGDMTDGAENGIGNWTSDVSGYDPIESGIETTGSNAFHLSLRLLAHTETLTLNRTLVPNANSQVSFDSRAVSFDHLIGRVEVSADGGATWDAPPLFEQDGGDEPGFTNNVLSLGAYAGRQITLRFSLDYAHDDGGVCECDSSSWYFDDVALSNIQEAGTPVLSAVGANPSFAFNPPVQSVFRIDVRPQLAGPTFGAFSQPLTVTSTPAAVATAPVVGMVDGAGNAYVKVGSLTSAWTKVTSGATAIAVATDPTNGPLIAVITGSGVYAKQGTVTGPWSHETAANIGANAIAVASNATNGPLIAINTPAGVYAKQGLTAPWTHVTAANIGVNAIAVASDATNGPLIAINSPTGVYAKQGTLTAPWTHLTAANIGVNAISVASDATNGPLIAINTPTGVYAKQGTLTTPWTHETAANIGANAIAVATDATHGPLVSINTPAGVYAKQGTLTTPWTHETAANIGANAIAVASDAANGPLIGINTPSGIYAKQGTLTTPWTHETAAAAQAISVAG